MLILKRHIGEHIFIDSPEGRIILTLTGIDAGRREVTVMRYDYWSEFCASYTIREEHLQRAEHYMLKAIGILPTLITFGVYCDRSINIVRGELAPGWTPPGGFPKYIRDMSLQKS